MIAYKFLRSGRTGPFSEFRWPDPGVWVHARSDLTTCRCGIHACRSQDLPWWFADELWEIELEGEVRFDEHKIVAPSGRLTRRIGEWTPACAQDYADACTWRTRDKAAAALSRAGHQQASDRLTTCATLGELASAARLLAEDLPDTRLSATIAADGALAALSGAAPASAFIAARAALRFDGPSGYAAERAWQSRWLVDRLGLRASCS